MSKTIYFDMDGTLYDLYGCANWLEKLEKEDVEVYLCGAALCNLSSLARTINRMKKDGYKFGIISWLSKNGNKKYNEKVIVAKQKWLKSHLPSVEWDEINIIEYGKSKKKNCGDCNGWIIDDDKEVRDDWGVRAISPQNIIKKLKLIYEIEENYYE